MGADAVTSIKVHASTRDRLKGYMTQVGASSAEDALARALFVAETIEALRHVDPAELATMRTEAQQLAEVDTAVGE
ncbi:MAG: hypothetical protein WCF04_04885 [Candidatus Nanopelagicales bacterium]